MTTVRGPYSGKRDWKQVEPHAGAGEDPNDVRYLDEDKLEKASQDSGVTKLPRSVR